MSGMEFVLAATLLSAPPGTPEPPVRPEEWPALQAALHHVAVEWEILDPRETPYVFAREEDFTTDLTLLRERYRDLEGAPQLWEADRFPERATVNELLTFNRNFRKHLDTQRLIQTDRISLLQAASRETDRLYQVYDLIRDARCDFYYVTVRRQSLKRLRDLIGAEDFYAGKLPPFVPVWHFQEID